MHLFSELCAGQWLVEVPAAFPPLPIGYVRLLTGADDEVAL
jgi:hypothetical protein